MSLRTYQRKRRFGTTPEPAGSVPGTTPQGSRRFVVQRHRATRLHYDFRLEIDGVLMSWAVPKGPTLDPSQRRMAVHVEDHPIEYFDFEGIIPRGEYGAGDVIVWDWGTWEPEETDDPGRAVAAGELKFRLLGEKLRGRFTLVRTGGRPPATGDDKEQWLLIHKKDSAAEAGWSVDDHPRSVKTGRTNDEVLAGKTAVWDGRAPAAEASIDLAGAVEAPLPEFIEPMTATLADRAFSDPDWLFELKLDGYRVQAVVSGGRVRLWTRNGQDGARYFPDLAAAKPSWIRAETAIVDGEVVALDDDGVPSFSRLQDRAGMGRFGASGSGLRGDRPRDPSARTAPITYFAFDLLYLDGRLLLDVPLEERKKLLRSVLREHPVVRYGSHIEADGETFYGVAAERGLEGLVAKERRSRYEPGRRSRSWLKLKIRREQELVVGGYEEGKGSHRDLGSLLVGVYANGELRFAGHVGSGIDARTRRELVAHLDAARRDDSPFVDAPSIRGVHWASPELVIRAEFAEWTTDGLLRQAAFKGMEIGKDPRSVIREDAVGSADAARAAERAAERADRAAARRPPRTARSLEPSLPPATATPPRAATPPQAATEDESAALEAMGSGGRWSIGGHEVTLSNLDKVLFPDAGYTKRDLIRYYVTIAPVLLPYLRDRALNLWRWPDGVTGKSFWQKEIPKYAPEWMARWAYPDAASREAHTYIVADRVATLAWLANHATIDLHPWTSTITAYRDPTYALIDIDPGERTTWEHVVTFARLYRAALDHLGVVGFPKVTGKRGIQIWVPVRPVVSYDDTRTWVEHISRAIGQALPDLVSWEWEKAARKGRARLDFTQNAVNKTLVAPYAVRPAAGAPVSAPITWEELDDPALRPDRWDIRTILERVRERGDPFAGALTTEQDLPPVA